MARQTKNSSSNKNTNTKTSKAKNTKTNTKKQSENKQSMKDEIIVLSLLAFSIIMLISNFGLGGAFGAFISKLLFGIMGWVGMIFPIILFIGISFVYINRENKRIYIKLIAGFLLIIDICAMSQILLPSHDLNQTLRSYYTYSSTHKTGGGFIGGVFAKILCPNIGTIGAIVVLLLILLICCIVVSEKSFIKVASKAGAHAKNDVSRRTQEARANRQVRREQQQEARELQYEEKRMRKNHSVSGVSFNTTLTANDEQQNTTNIPDLFENKDIDSDYLKQSKVLSESDMEHMSIVKSTENKQQLGEQVSIESIERTERKPRKTKESKQEIEQETSVIEQKIQTRNDSNGAYVFPSLDLLSKGKSLSSSGKTELRETAIKLQQVLHSFGVDVQVTDYSKGPSVTRYELQPEKGVKVSRIVGLADDIKLNLAAADIRIEAPIPGKAAVGIEVPNKENTTVALRSLLESKEFLSHESNLAFAAGKDIGGKTIVTDIAKMPHVLIAGSTGSGKSVCINTLIMSILYKANPEDVKLIMIDPKVVELSVYNGIPHLLIPVVTDPKKAAGALHWAVAEMTKRYQLFADYNVRDLKGYNDKIKTIEHIEDETKPEKMPQIVVIVDELADLMMVAPGDVEEAICRLAQLARAAGIHLILATQRPSVNVITGLIKANMPSRIAFAVSSGVDSRTIIDMNGAEKLLGKGDMLFYPAGYPKPARVQGAFVSDKEVQSVVAFLIKQQGEVSYNTEVEQHVTSSASGVGSSASIGGSSADELDTYFVEAGKFIIEKDKASIGMLQRMFKIGFNRAARIMDQLCDAGVVGEEEGTKPRKIIMSMEQFEQYIEESV